MTTINNDVNSDIKGQTLELINSLRKLDSGSAAYIKLRNHIVLLNKGLAEKVADRFEKAGKANPHNYSLEYEELLQLAMMGLIKAVERFNPLGGKHKFHAFSSFAMPYCSGEILHYFRDKIHPIKIHPKSKKINSQLNKLTRRLEREGRFMSFRQIAEELGVSIDELSLARLELSNSFVVSLDELHEVEGFELPCNPSNTCVLENSLDTDLEEELLDSILNNSLEGVREVLGVIWHHLTDREAKSMIKRVSRSLEGEDSCWFQRAIVQIQAGV